MVVISLLIVLGLLVEIGWAAISTLRLFKRRRLAARICPNCWYPLLDTVGGRCAECGDVMPDASDLGELRDLESSFRLRSSVLALATVLTLTIAILPIESVQRPAGDIAGAVVVLVFIWAYLACVLGQLSTRMPRALLSPVLWQPTLAYCAAAVVAGLLSWLTQTSGQDRTTLVVGFGLCAGIGVYAWLCDRLRHALAGGRRRLREAHSPKADGP